MVYFCDIIYNNDKVSDRIHIRGSELKETDARAILYLYESKLSQVDYSYNDCLAVQLMEKKTKVNLGWETFPNNKDEEEIRTMLVGTLGNYALIEESKKKMYKKQTTPRGRLNEINGDKEFQVNKYFLDEEKQIWTDDKLWARVNIEKRNECLAEDINKYIWKIK